MTQQCGGDLEGEVRWISEKTSLQPDHMKSRVESERLRREVQPSPWFTTISSTKQYCSSLSRLVAKNDDAK